MSRRTVASGGDPSEGRRAGGGDPAGRRRAGSAAAAAALLPMLLATAACGGSADAAGGDAGAALTVMTWAPAGTGSTDRPGVTALAEEIGREVNAKGGRAGRKLKVLTCNEHNTAAGVTACAQQAVAAHAVAVIGSYSQFGDTFMPTLEAAGIPYLGGYGVSGSEFSSPLSYPVAGGTPALIAGSGRQLAAAGCKAVALIRPDTGNGDTLTRYLSAAVAPAGIRLTDVKVPERADAAGMAAPVQRAVGDDRAGGCVTAALGPEQTLLLLDAYRKANPRRTQLASVIGSVHQAVIDSTGGAGSPLNGSLATGWFPPETSKVWDDLRTTAGNAAASGAKPVDTSDLAVQTTWVAYQTFLQAVDRISSAGQPLTAKGLRAQLDSGDSIDTGGVTPPLNWGQGDMLPSAESPRLTNTWVTFQQVKDGRLTEQQSGFVDVRWVLTGGKPPQ
ncbi:ABC transporter substrate-binding protein [Kitasatospora sp. NBC_00374]|uniref:ABC transporter substrate-binding protein n=1 Tax=Kitasatospora sp. NBC_00374 TaxID=2975964 RepID=UPI0030DDE3E8